MSIWYARSAHPEAAIFLLAHSDVAGGWAASGARLRFLRTLRVVLVNASALADTQPPGAAARFAAGYRHSSTNGVAYERFCMARYLSVRALLERGAPQLQPGRDNATRVFMLDLDFVLFGNVFDAFDALGGDWGSGSYFSSWTLPKLVAFTDWFTQLYDSSDDALATALLALQTPRITADELAEPAEDIRAAVAAWWPFP